MSERQYYHTVYNPTTKSNDIVYFTEEEIAKRQLEEQIEEQKSIEEQWKKIREERNKLLLNCDWTQLSDTNVSEQDRILWSAYRQQLRDLPSTITDPFDVVWPVPPV